MKKGYLFFVCVFYFGIINSYVQKYPPLHICDFELEDYAIPERISYLEKLGFGGITFPVNSSVDLATLDQYLTAVFPLKKIPITAVFTTFNFSQGNHTKTWGSKEYYGESMLI